MSNRQPPVRLPRTPLPPMRAAREERAVSLPYLPVSRDAPPGVGGAGLSSPGVELHASGATLLRPSALDPDLRAFVLAYFNRDVLPVLTPMTVDAAHPFPRLREGLVCVAQLATIGDARPNRGGDLLLIPVPASAPRWVSLAGAGRPTVFVRLQDVIRVGVEQVYGLAGSRLHVLGLVTPAGPVAQRRIEHHADVPAPLLARIRRALGVDASGLVVTDEPLGTRDPASGDAHAFPVPEPARSCA